jgi:outer membrane PBP1 activator LpoA protein
MTMLTRTLIILFLFFSLLSGCGKSVIQPDETPTNVAIKDPADVAKNLEMKGDYRQAAQEYLRIAAQTTPPTQQGHQLSAIKAFLKGGMLKEAKTELDNFDISQGYSLEIPLELVLTKIDLEEQRVSKAQERLNGIDLTTLPMPLQIEYKQLHAQALVVKEKVAQGVREWVEIDNLANADTLVIQDNHLQLWRSLLSIPRSKLRQVPQQNDITSGWVALALLAKTARQQYLPQGINNWQLRFQNHPATQYVVPRLLQNIDKIPTQPTKVALLLPPVRHKFGKHAAAIKNGIITTVNAEPKTLRPKIVVYEVNPKNILKIYQKAVDDGADFVVGPLVKETITVLAKSKVQLPLPTLALNHLGTVGVTGNLYQFSLSPQDEAMEVARRALADGHKSALAIVPKLRGGWGERVVTAFKTEWEKQGGKIVGTDLYDENFDSSIPKILRKSAKTADMVFMVAFPDYARSIRPLISKYAARMPIYSTSHLYSGTPNPKLDAKLEDIMFVDMPWVLAPDEKAARLQATLRKSWAKDMAKYKRYYAFGVDAYALVLQIQQSSEFKWQGQSGGLFVNRLGEVHREQLRWARFVDGKAQVLD